MESYSVHYKFSQRFNFPALDAYLWCTDFQSVDVRLMGEEGKRHVQRINEDTLILTDTVIIGGAKVTTKRLVRLFPESLFWTNTRLSPEGRHSQFLYQIVPEGERCSRLDFTGSQVFYGCEKPAPGRIALVAEELAKGDARAWKSLAKAMEKLPHKSKA